MENQTSRTEVSREVNNFYDRVLLKRLLPFLQYLKFAQIRDIPRNSGTNTIKFRRYNSLAPATTPLREGVTPIGSQLSVTDITASVAQYGDYVTLTDVVQYETPDPILTETAEVLAEQARETLDELGKDVFSAGTSVQYSESAAGVVATDRDEVNDNIREKTILKTVRTLHTNKVKKITSIVNPSDGYNTTPINSAYVGIVGPKVLFDLKQLTNWVSVEKYPNKSDVMEGEVGALDEVRFILSENSKVFEGEGSGETDVHGTLVLGRDAIGMTRISGEALRNILKPLGSGGSADPLDQRATSGWKATFVAKILNELCLVRMETLASS